MFLNIILVINKIPFYYKELRHGFALETLLAPMKKGFRVITVPAKWKKRVEGNSSITIESYVSYLKVFFRFL